MQTAKFSKVLPFREIAFNSVELEASTLPVNDTSEFGSALYTTISQLRKQGRKAVFLKVNMLYAHYIPIAGMYGFKFHSAEGDYASLLLWLPTKEDCKVPVFATHHCGVGGAVVSQGKILVVKEKHKMSGWKLPGGYMNLHEDISSASVREVLEETGINSKFDGILTVRHQQNVQFNRSGELCSLTE